MLLLLQLLLLIDAVLGVYGCRLIQVGRGGLVDEGRVGLVLPGKEDRSVVYSRFSANKIECEESSQSFCLNFARKTNNRTCFVACSFA